MSVIYRKGRKLRYDSVDTLIKKEFGEYNIIVRAPGAAFFFGEHAVVKGQPALYLPIPLYLYLGLDKSSKGMCVDFYYHDPKCNIYPANKNQKRINLKRLKNEEAIVGEKTITEILAYALEKSGEKPINLKVKVISEIPIKCGLNSSGAFAATFSTAFYLLKGKITQDDIQKWRTLIQNNNIQSLKYDKNFMKVFKLAYLIDKEIQGNTSGIGPLASLIGSPEGKPLMYFRYVPIQDYGYFKSVDVKRIENDVDIFEKFHAFYVRKSVKDSKLTPTSAGPFLILAYSGIQSETSEAFSAYNGKLTSFNITITQLSNKLRNNLDEASNGIKLDINNEFYLVSPLRTYLILENDDTTRNYLDSRFMGILGGYALAGIGEFEKDPTSSEVFTLMSQYHDLLKTLDLSSQKIDKLKRIIDSKSEEYLEKHPGKRERGEAGVGVKLTGSGGGGDLIIWGKGNSNYYSRYIKAAICKRGKNKTPNAIHFDSVAHIKLFPNSPWAEGITIIKLGNQIYETNSDSSLKAGELLELKESSSSPSKMPLSTLNNSNEDDKKNLGWGDKILKRTKKRKRKD